MVRAKFYVNSVKEHDGVFDVHLMPVSSGSDENKQYWSATPAGSIMISTVNPFAGNQFKQGREYYVDFIDAAENTPPKAE